jgi:iron complex outermembrane receptor protein
MNLGFSTNVVYKILMQLFYIYAFGHYLYNNTANAFFFKEPLIQDEMCQLT